MPPKARTSRKRHRKRRKIDFFFLALFSDEELVGETIGLPRRDFKDTFLLEFFSLVRKERKGQKEERFPLLIFFCRLAATSANKVRRPSRHSIAAATGSKRPPAPTRIYCCAMSGYGKPRGWSLGAGLGANIAR